MKQFLKIAFVLFICLTSINTSAMQYKTVEIFPSSEKSTVATNTFIYSDFLYVPPVKGRKFGTIDFENITNKSDKQIPISINILMFDKSKKNIGFITYCSTKDISSDYSQMKIKANASSPFSITISDTYFVDGYSASDIYYLAVLDENKYCQIGGYEKYKGLTIEQISDGVVASNLDKDGNEKFNFSEFFDKLDIQEILSTIIISLVSLFVVGVILNMLSKRIFASASILAYIPLTNCFIAIKCCFGKKISYLYLFLLIISIPLYFVLFLGKILLYMLFIISFIAFIIDIYKLITRKYEFCFYEPKVENSSLNSNYANQNLNKHDSFIKNNENSGDKIIDLSFSTPNPNDENLFSNNSSNNSSYGSVIDEKSNKNNEGESDLSKFFR